MSQYIAVVNHEQQYSIWPATKEIPKGWKQCYPAASKEKCLQFIAENWQDLRPLSLREMRK